MIQSSPVLYVVFELSAAVASGIWYGVLCTCCPQQTLRHIWLSPILSVLLHPGGPALTSSRSTLAPEVSQIPPGGLRGGLGHRVTGHRVAGHRYVSRSMVLASPPPQLRQTEKVCTM